MQRLQAIFEVMSVGHQRAEALVLRLDLQVVVHDRAEACSGLRGLPSAFLCGVLPVCQLAEDALGVLPGVATLRSVARIAIGVADASTEKASLD